MRFAESTATATGLTHITPHMVQLTWLSPGSHQPIPHTVNKGSGTTLVHSCARGLCMSIMQTQAAAQDLCLHNRDTNALLYIEATDTATGTLTHCCIYAGEGSTLTGASLYAASVGLFKHTCHQCPPTAVEQGTLGATQSPTHFCDCLCQHLDPIIQIHKAQEATCTCSWPL